MRSRSHRRDGSDIRDGHRRVYVKIHEVSGLGWSEPSMRASHRPGAQAVECGPEDWFGAAGVAWIVAMATIMSRICSRVRSSRTSWARCAAARSGRPPGGDHPGATVCE